ncbi:hypothetical protein PS865_03572 [Pseudomonas fluorescens]|nr:hypothetical protein PS865_03572 [Pseudomonas fluorescens]
MAPTARRRPNSEANPVAKPLANGDGRPTDQRYAVGEARAKPVSDKPRRHQRQRIGPGECGKNQAHLDLVQTQILGHERRGDRDVHPVDVIDDRRDQQQRQHEPAPPRRQTLRRNGIACAGYHRRHSGTGGMGVGHAETSLLLEESRFFEQPMPLPATCGARQSDGLQRGFQTFRNVFLRLISRGGRAGRRGEIAGS